MNTTTFIIPTLERSTLQSAINSVGDNPYLTGFDIKHEGAGIMRNRMIEIVETPWVSFLDDDDMVLPYYVQLLEKEIAAHPEADLIHFREYFPDGHMLPSWPEVEWGNVGICFSVKTDWARKHPFKAEEFEDLEFVKRLQAAGANIYFSKHITYLARPHLL